MEKYLGLVLCGAILLSGCGSGGSSTASIVERLTISTASLPNATWELPYSQMVQTSGGVAPFTWTVSAGALPFNLALGSTTNNAVTISGTPVAVAQGVAFTIKVTDSANQSATQSYTVSTLLGPDTLTFSPQGLNFGMQPVGTTTAKQSETLTNTGSQELIINSVATIGTDAMDFNQSGGCGSSLAAGANCTLFMTFTPSFTGPRSASISIDDNSTGSPHSLSLTGVGVTSGPNATLSTIGLNFSSVPVGTTSPAQSVTVSNYGTTTLDIANVAASADFGETTTCSSTLVSGANCAINVTFTPSSSGSLSGTLSLTDNAPGSPQTVTLRGSTCIHQGAACYGPSTTNTCCPAPFPLHSACSNKTGWGTCVEF